MTPTETDSPGAFADLGLAPAVLAALSDVGYESPSPIQAATIPVILAGHDLLGQAQTGTGKTAAFALPLLSMLDVARREPQVLVLVPTRELAIQVAEAFQKYAGRLSGFHVLPIYGGQSYTPQLNALRRGPHVIVGTPGASSITSSAAHSSSPRCASSCSTRPTRCCRWGSSTRSSRS